MSILVYDEKLAMEAAIEDARDAWEEGREEGWANAATKIATKLLKKNRPIDEIMECTELSLEQINKIIAEN